MSRAWFELQFPYLLEAGQLEAWLRQLHGMSTPGRRDAWIVQAVSDGSGIRHQVGLVPERAKAVQAQAEACMPGALLVPLTTAPTLAATANDGALRAWRLWLSTSRRPLRLDDPETTSRGLLTALAQVRGSERLVLQWWLGPVRRPVVVPNAPSASLGESWAYALTTAAVLGPKALDSEARRALRLKQGQPGWRAVGRIAVAGATQERSRFLLGLVAGAFRAAEAPGVALGVRRISPEIISKYRKPWRWTFAASITEFSALLAWPLQDVGQLPVQRRAARLLPVPRGVPRRGLVVAVEPLRQRPLAISSRDLRQHLHLGTGLPADPARALPLRSRRHPPTAPLTGQGTRPATQPARARCLGRPPGRRSARPRHTQRARPGGTPARQEPRRRLATGHQQLPGRTSRHLPRTAHRTLPARWLPDLDLHGLRPSLATPRTTAATRITRPGRPVRTDLRLPRRPSPRPGARPLHWQRDGGRRRRTTGT